MSAVNVRSPAGDGSLSHDRQLIAQRTVEFRERGLHGLHRAKRGFEPLLHRLDPTRGGQRLVG